MGKGSVDLTPEQRAAAAERARLLKSPGRGLSRSACGCLVKSSGWPAWPRACDGSAGKFPKVETTEPPEPTPRQPKRRKDGGGNKPLLSEKQIKDGKAVYRRMLDEDEAWAENKTASATRVIELLKLGNSVSVWTVKRWIVALVWKSVSKISSGVEQNKRAILILLAVFLICSRFLFH